MSRNLRDGRAKGKIVIAFMHALGWHNVHRFKKRLKFNELDNNETEIVWYESGEIGDNRTDCFLQVDELGCTKNLVLCSAAVYAPRFRICTGWHPVQLDAAGTITEEVDRLRNWLDYRNFSSYSNRRLFRQMHPEAVGYSWKFIRRFGPPYIVMLKCKQNRIFLRQEMSALCRKSQAEGT
jgi:hypothetical protein